MFTRLWLTRAASAAGAILAVWAAVALPAAVRAAFERQLILVPMTIDAMRRPIDVSGQLFVLNAGSRGDTVDLVALRIYGDDALVMEQAVTTRLAGDPRFGEAAEMIERLPTSITGRRRPRAFAHPDAPDFSRMELLDRRAELRELISDLQQNYQKDPKTQPFVALDFTLPLSELIGDVRLANDLTVVFELDYVDRRGVMHTETATHAIRIAQPLPPNVPESLSRVAAGFTVHAGDLHVHSCHGEALNACAPSSDCLAESLQILGSFTYAQLKSQYQALGIDWFAATDHSYCVNSESEYQIIVAETENITDTQFVAFPDLELSSDEAGPQSGSDLGDLLCLTLTEMNHMGAHGITSRLRGGDDGLLGFCDGLFSDALRSFVDNVAAIRAQGGYPIANHPALGQFGWNSLVLSSGIESNGLHGVEIWTGDFQSGQGSHVGVWVKGLLAGRLLYGYSGSDTHDAAFDFGANQVILRGPFTPENLKRAIMGGRVFISNGHFLATTVQVDAQTLLMGDIRRVPVGFPPGQGAQIDVHYDFGADTATITLFRGRVGDAQETALCTSAPLDGSGFFSCPDTIDVERSSYYRAYSENLSGTRIAYANPIFIRVQ